MKIADYFKKPIKTYCLVQGEEVDVMVECDYQPPEPRVNVAEQVEVIDVRNLRGVSIMDSMYMVELEELEDRLLAMAKSGIEVAEDAFDRIREIAQEEQQLALHQGAVHRRTGA